MQDLLTDNGEFGGDEGRALDNRQTSGMREPEVARILAGIGIGIGNEYLGATVDMADRFAECVGLSRKIRPHALHLKHANRQQQDEHRGKAAPHEVVAQIEVRAGDHHECQRDRQPLVRHVGVEHDARQRPIGDAADRKQRPSVRMDV